MGANQFTPCFENPKFEVTCEYINRKVGVHLNAEQICQFLKRMCLTATPIQDGSSFFLFSKVCFPQNFTKFFIFRIGQCVCSTNKIRCFASLRYHGRRCNCIWLRQHSKNNSKLVNHGKTIGNEPFMRFIETRSCKCRLHWSIDLVIVLIWWKLHNAGKRRKITRRTKSCENCKPKNFRIRNCKNLPFAGTFEKLE